MASVSGSIGLTNQFQFREKYEQLKEAEQKEKLLKPRERVDKIEAQHKDIDELISKLNAIKTTAGDILDSKLLGQKNLKTEGESASVSVSKGVSAMDFSIDVKKLATKDTFQTNAAKNEETSVFSGQNVKYEKDGERKVETFDSADFKISVGEKSFQIHVDKFTTLSQLADKLNNAKTSDEDNTPLKDLLNVKIIDAGKDGFRLMLGSKKSGEENSIKFDIVGDDEATRAASTKALEVLGFASFLDEQKADELVEKSQKLLDESLNLTGSEKFDDEAYLKSLGAGKLELETAKGDKFSIDKDTDLLHLSQDQLDAVYENQRKEEIAEWAVEQGKIGQIDISKDNINELSKDPQKWEQIENSFYEQKLEKWLTHLQDEKLSTEVKIPDASNPDISNILKVGTGEDSKQFSELSADEKNALKEHYKKLLKESFDAQIGLVNAQDKLEAAKEIADKNHIQRGSDAVFKYEGIEITRAENTVDDLILGAKIKLIKEGNTDFRIEASSDELIKNLDEFVSAFNSFANNINAATDYDKDSKQAKGSLMGVNEIQDARSKLMSLLGKNINGLSLNALGITVNKSGIVEFDHTVFKDAYEKDANAVEKFLLGGTDYEEFSLTSKPISAMPAISVGDLVINDKKISLNSDFIMRLNGLNKDGVEDPSVVKPTMKEYQQELLRAIKDAEIEGISAHFDENGSLVLKSDGKQGISIEGIDEKLMQLGLENKSMSSTGKTNKGIFDEVQTLIKRLTSEEENKEGTLVKFNMNLKEEKKKITEDMDAIKKDIDARFDTLKDRLIRYDAILYKMDLQRQAVEGAMKAAFAQKN